MGEVESIGQTFRMFEPTPPDASPRLFAAGSQDTTPSSSPPYALRKGEKACSTSVSLERQPFAKVKLRGERQKAEKLLTI